MTVINDIGFPFTDQNGDRLYTSSDWREYFNALVTGGVIGAIKNELKVMPQGVPNKSVYVDTGAILINGALRIMESTTSLTVADNASGNPRIDRIVARLDYANRLIEFAVKQGTPAAIPTAPALTQNAAIYELSLAKITLANGYTTITSGVITDERLDEAICGYFKYRAKPSWYPGGTPAIDAWMYTNFKAQLTAQQILDIEANTSLMAIINSGNMKLVNERIRKLSKFSGLEAYTAADATISTNTTLTDKINVYNNLTINAGITLTCTVGTTLIYVKGTLNLLGTIDATGKGTTAGAVSAPAGSGGDGGGVIILIANKIIGNGAIKANGINGFNSSGTAPTSTAGGTSGAIGTFRGNITPKTKAALTPDKCLLTDTGGQGGQAGYKDDASGYNGTGGSGGAGVIGSGGAGQNAVSGGSNGSPGGGGGGGAIVIISVEAIPTLTIQAMGGNAGALVSSPNGNAAGGGGGGLVSIFAPASTSTPVVTGGSGGAAGYNGVNGVNGSAGLYEFFAMDAA